MRVPEKQPHFLNFNQRQLQRLGTKYVSFSWGSNSGFRSRQGAISHKMKPQNTHRTKICHKRFMSGPGNGFRGRQQTGFFTWDREGRSMRPQTTPQHSVLLASMAPQFSTPHLLPNPHLLPPYLFSYLQRRIWLGLGWKV